ncbi:18614_t:CDS:2 [Racocetra persica]|uniref:18614_t:CDS:1 n=1 Tax=Racocetra persica TaxID=160502 RepID=A0ACA9K8Z4_9GLOM|nr:18614_t:CDS:2 [Racocetra persica]
MNLSLRENISGVDDSSDYDSPGWSECEECYGPKKEFCNLCGCSVSGNWYCIRCSKKSKHKTQPDDSNSSNNTKKIKKSNRNKKLKNVEITEPTDEASRNAENECISSTSTNNESIHQTIGNLPEVFKDKRSNNNYQQYNESYKECDDELSQQIYDNEEEKVKGKQKELFELNSDSDEVDNKKKRLSCELQIENIIISMIYSNNLKFPLEYITSLKKIRARKEINNIFSSNKDPTNLQGMFSQGIDFNEVPTPVSLESLPKHLQSVEDCHKYLRI